MRLMGAAFGSGKFKDLVGQKGRGPLVYYARAYQPNVRNPRTQRQLVQRQRMQIMGQFMGSIAPWAAKMGMGTEKLSPFANLMSFNLKNAITGTYPNQEVDFTLCLVSQGPVDLPYSPSATADGTSLSLTWSDNSNMGNALTDDKVCVMAWNPTKKQSVYSLNLAERNERSATFTLPTAWTGDTVNVWMAMRREGDANHKAGNSQSVHLASLTL